MRYFDAVSWCRFQTYRSNIRTVKEMLIWRHIYFAMASLIAQCTFKIVDVCQQRFPYICFDEVAIIVIYIWFTTVAFWSLNFQWLPNFSALYMASFDNIFVCSQLNWPWHFKQWSVAPELSYFSFMLSCWCSIVLFITFFFVLPIYPALQLHFNV